MVYPFELYCKGCGCKILSFGISRFEELIGILQEDMPVDSWLSENLRGRHLRCPGCGRRVGSEPLIKADVMFSDWSDESEADKTVVYYV